MTGAVGTCDAKLLTTFENVIVDHLRAMARLQRSRADGEIFSKPESFEQWVYRSAEECVLLSGAWFQPAPLPARYVRRVPKACFDNAYKLATASRGRLRYVEGYALPSSIDFPMHHAWCANDADEVIDPTWHDVGRAYRGVVVSLPYLRSLRVPECVSALLNWPNDFPMLRKGIAR